MCVCVTCLNYQFDSHQNFKNIFVFVLRLVKREEKNNNQIDTTIKYPMYVVQMGRLSQISFNWDSRERERKFRGCLKFVIECDFISRSITPYTSKHIKSSYINSSRNWTSDESDRTIQPFLLWRFKVILFSIFAKRQLLYSVLNAEQGKKHFKVFHTRSCVVVVVAITTVVVLCFFSSSSRDIKAKCQYVLRKWKRKNMYWRRCINENENVAGNGIYIMTACVYGNINDEMWHRKLKSKSTTSIATSTEYA